MYTKQPSLFYFRRTTQFLNSAQMVGPWETDLTLYSLVLALETCALILAPLFLLVNMFTSLSIGCNDLFWLLYDVKESVIGGGKLRYQTAELPWVFDVNHVDQRQNQPFLPNKQVPCLPD